MSKIGSRVICFYGSMGVLYYVYHSVVVSRCVARFMNIHKTDSLRELLALPYVNSRPAIRYCISLYIVYLLLC